MGKRRVAGAIDDDGVDVCLGCGFGFWEGTVSMNSCKVTRWGYLISGREIDWGIAGGSELIAAILECLGVLDERGVHMREM